MIIISWGQILYSYAIRHQTQYTHITPGYLLARTLLDIPEDSAVLVVEDAPAGILAGKAAGFDVAGLLTSHKRVEVEAAKPDFVLGDLESVEFVGVDETDGGVFVLIGDPGEQMN